MFVQGLAAGISAIATEQMVLYKICRGQSIFHQLSSLMIGILLEERYNLTASFCSNIEQHTEDPIYADVEKEARYYTFSFH